MKIFYTNDAKVTILGSIGKYWFTVCARCSDDGSYGEPKTDGKFYTTDTSAERASKRFIEERSSE